MKNLIAASTSTIHGGNYLEYILPALSKLFSGVDTILFIPFARPGGISHKSYTDKAAKAFQKIDKKLLGIHDFHEPIQALLEAQAVFTGGGNTFVLVQELYKRNLMAPLRQVLLKGTPYLGTSAGSNICGITMQTTNDMPIVYPPSFKTTGVLPCNINAHYLDPDPDSQHMGETRETRIHEFHSQNTIPVIGLREGSWLRMEDKSIVLNGNYSARLFRQGKDPIEVASQTDLTSLIT